MLNCWHGILPSTRTALNGGWLLETKVLRCGWMVDTVHRRSWCDQMWDGRVYNGWYMCFIYMFKLYVYIYIFNMCIYHIGKFIILAKNIRFGPGRGKENPIINTLSNCQSSYHTTKHEPTSNHWRWLGWYYHSPLPTKSDHVGGLCGTRLCFFCQNQWFMGTVWYMVDQYSLTITTKLSTIT